MELWRARPGDVIVLPVFPGQVTVEDTGSGSRYEESRVSWSQAGGMSGTLDLSDFLDVRLLAAGDGVNAVWLEQQAAEAGPETGTGPHPAALHRSGRTPGGPYVKDPLNPTSAELSAAIQRGLENGTILTAGQFLEQAAQVEAAEADREADDLWAGAEPDAEADTEADARAAAELAAEIMAHDLTTMLDGYGMEPEDGGPGFPGARGLPESEIEIES